jgi:hypothetical protein
MKRELAERHLRHGRHFAYLTHVTTSSGHTAKLDPISRQVKIFGFNLSCGLNFQRVLNDFLTILHKKIKTIYEHHVYQYAFLIFV